MTLLPDEIKRKLPSLYSQENIKDPFAHVKFFCPWFSWTWYAVEFDGKDLFFGKVIGQESELGYFSLSELKNLRGPGGLRIERDIHFQPVPLSQCKCIKRG